MAVTKEDNGIEDPEKKQISIRMPVGLISKVEAEMKDWGITSASPIYVKAVKFYFDNKDNPAYMTSDQINAMIEAKMSALLTDPERIEALRRRILRI